MKKIYTIAILLISSIASFGQAPNWLWAKSTVGTGNDGATSVAVDASGNTYVTGVFESPTITFGSTTLINADNTGYTYDLFLTKYDANGNMLWAKKAGGVYDDNTTSIAVDTSGNIYVAGYFSSPTLTFGFTTLTNTTTNIFVNIFLVKYDTNGNVLWAKSTGGTGDDKATSVTVDTSGNIYVVGWFNSPTLTFGITTLNAGGGYSSIFLAKYDSNGNVLWAKSAGDWGDADATSVAVDASGNIYVAGYFESSTITFGSTTLTNVGNGDIFLAKYDDNGNVLWAKRAGGWGGDYASSIAVDALGNSYLVGYYSSSTITFGSTTLTNAGSFDIFLVKYDANGNVLWAKGAGGTSYDYAHVTVDASGNSYLTGNFYSPTITFSTTTLTNTSVGYDIFLAKYNANGNELWVKSAGGTGQDYACPVAVDASRNIYLAGSFDSPTLTFGSTTLTNAGNSDIFFAKLAAFAVTITQHNVSCNGGNNGTATVNAAGGTSPYTYLWNTVPAQTTQIATSLTAGSYIVTVTDANGASVTANITITQPGIILINNPQTICNGSSYGFNGHTYTIAGNYYDTLTSIHGCDSIIITQLTVNPLPASAGTISGITTVCQGQNSVTYTVPTIANATSYIWTLLTGAIGTSTTNSITVSYDTSAVSGNIIVKGHNSCGDGATSNIAITVNLLPQTPTITLHGDTLTSDAANGNKWYNTSGLINGATDSIYIPLVTGNYYVIVTDSNGCVSDTSNIIYFGITGLTDFSYNKNIYIYPNPATNNITVESPPQAVIEISNIQGQLIKTLAASENHTSIDISGFASGMYFVKVKTEKGVAVKKFVKE